MTRRGSRWSRWFRRDGSGTRPTTEPREVAPISDAERRLAFRLSVVRLVVARSRTPPGTALLAGPYGDAMDLAEQSFNRTDLQEAVDGLAPDYDACTSDEARAALLSRYSRW